MFRNAVMVISFMLYLHHNLRKKSIEAQLFMDWENKIML